MVTEKIQAAYAKLRKSEQKVAAYMLEHPEQMETISLELLAEAADVSQPTVYRMIRAVGYQSFKELKLEFAKEQAHKSERKMGDVLGMPISQTDQVEDVPGKVILNTIGLLEDSLRSISSKSLKKTVQAIEKAEHICLFSVENSNIIASDLTTKLLYLGISCEFVEDYYLQSVRAGHMTERDVAIGISYSGTSQNTVDVMRRAKKSGAVTIAITNFTDTPLVECSDIVLITSDKQFLYGEDIFSRTVHTAVVDMIYMGLLVNDYEKYEERLETSSSMVKSRKIK